MADLPPKPPEIAELRHEVELRKARLDVLKVAYFNRTPFDGKVPIEEDVREAAREFIESNYALQKKLFGKIQVKLSVANLLR